VTWCHGLGTAASDWQGIVEVTAISGAAFMGRRVFLEELGGLEEAYFMYMEDVDLSLRARTAGAICAVSCDAIAEHDWTLALTPKKFGLLERNRRAVWGRFIGPSNVRWLPLLQAEAMAWVYAALRGRPYLNAKARAVRSPLLIREDRHRDQRVIGALSTTHPFHVLFPNSRLVPRLGRFADSIVNRAVSFSSTHRREDMGGRVS
jgi:GT2 family glycosyltransferase